MKRIRRIVAVVATAASAAAAGACKDVNGEARPAPRPVKVTEARTPDAPSGVRYAVSIQPYEQIALSFKSSGYVDRVLRRKGADGRSRALQAGDFVQAGTIVARVRQEDYRERVAQAASSLREAEAGEVKARLDLDRAQYLFAADALAKPDRDLAQAAYDQGAARVASARAQLQIAANALEDAALSVPRDGVILERKIEVGSLVNVGSVGFVIGDVSAVKAVFGVPDSMVHRIAPGQPLAVTTDAFHGVRFEGTVTTVAPSADSQTRVFDIEVTIPNADRRLRPGMIGAVEFTPDGPAAVSAGVAVPLSAVVRSAAADGQYTVFVAEGAGDEAVVRVRAVRLGAVRGNLVEVTDGLRDGERVVVMGAGLVVDGEMVKVIP